MVVTHPVTLAVTSTLSAGAAKPSVANEVITADTHVTITSEIASRTRSWIASTILAVSVRTPLKAEAFSATARIASETVCCLKRYASTAWPVILDIALLELESISSAMDASDSAIDCQLALIPKTCAESPVKSLSISLRGPTCSRMKLIAISAKMFHGFNSNACMVARAVSIAVMTPPKSPFETATALRYRSSINPRPSVGVELLRLCVWTGACAVTSSLLQTRSDAGCVLRPDADGRGTSRCPDHRCYPVARRAYGRHPRMRLHEPS